MARTEKVTEGNRKHPAQVAVHSNEAPTKGQARLYPKM